MLKIRIAVALLSVCILFGACSEESEVSQPDQGLVEVGESAGASTDPGTRPRTKFALAVRPNETPFGDIPYPSDLYIDSSGFLDLNVFPQRRNAPRVNELCDALEATTQGFATNGSFYLPFEDPINVERLPQTAQASLEPDSTLVLVDIDPQSPHQGERYPLQWKVFEEATPYIPAHTLAIRTFEGFPLRPKTTYALYIRVEAAQATPQFLEMLAVQFYS